MKFLKNSQYPAELHVRNSLFFKSLICINHERNFVKAPLETKTLDKKTFISSGPSAWRRRASRVVMSTLLLGSAVTSGTLNFGSSQVYANDLLVSQTERPVLSLPGMEERTPVSTRPITVAEVSKISPTILDSANLDSASLPQIRPSLQSSKSVSSQFQSLLVGDDLSGWVIQDGRENSWSREGNVISCQSSSGGWLRTQQKYSDFELRLEYRLEAGGNTGVGVRFPAGSNPSSAGFEVQLLDDHSPKYQSLRPDQYTGSLYYQSPVQTRAPVNPIGEWNQCEIHCKGDQIVVMINGVKVNDVLINQTSKPEGHVSETGETKSLSKKLHERPPLGFIALQSHSSRIEFRSIEIKNLAVTKPSGIQQVDLTTGHGAALRNAQTAEIHYVGQLEDGLRFNDTRDFGPPVNVSLDMLISGLREGLEGMQVGGKRRIIVPSHLAYGREGVEGAIPPNSTLVLEVELFNFR